VLLPWDAVAAVLVQLEGQWRIQNSAEGQTSYANPQAKATGHLHATRSQQACIGVSSSGV